MEVPGEIRELLPGDMVPMLLNEWNPRPFQDQTLS